MSKTYNDFKSKLIFTRKYIVVPQFGRTKIDKVSFIVNGKYNVQKQENYLKKFYKKYYGKC